MSEHDRQLIRRMQAGDRRAANEFLREWYPRIERWVARATSPDNVEDYTQEVILHLADNGWRRLFQWRGLFAADTDNPHSLAGFLRTVTRRKVIDLIRADGSARTEDLDPDELPDDGGGSDRPEEIQIREQFKLAFRACFARLQPKDQRMLLMRLKGRSDEEIAEKYGRTTASVRQRRAQAVRMLRKCLSIRAPGHFGDD